MSDVFERTDYHNDDHTRQLTVKSNQHGIGLDIGWRFWGNHPDDQHWVEVYWGNCKDATAFRALLDDPAMHDREWVLSDEARTLIGEDHPGSRFVGQEA
jgi:hypothetical protein